jgi:hypothetical protein
VSDPSINRTASDDGDDTEGHVFRPLVDDPERARLRPLGDEDASLRARQKATAADDTEGHRYLAEPSEPSVTDGDDGTEIKH